MQEHRTMESKQFIDMHVTEPGVYVNWCLFLTFGYTRGKEEEINIMWNGSSGV